MMRVPTQLLDHPDFNSGMSWASSWPRIRDSGQLIRYYPEANHESVFSVDFTLGSGISRSCIRQLLKMQQD